MKTTTLKQIKEKINENIAGRKLVVWGKGTNSKELEAFIESDLGIEIEFWVDSDINKVDQIQVKNCDCLDGKADKYYVCVSLSFELEEIHFQLAEYGYSEEKDYIYQSERHAPVRLYKVENYTERWGNRIEGNLEGCSIILKGRNAYIKIGENCSANNLTIEVANDSFLSLGKAVDLNNRFQEKSIVTYIQLDDQAELVIEAEVRIVGPGDIKLNEGAKLIIEKNTRINTRFDFHILYNTDIIIGRDCLFSTYVSMWSNDGHPIYDLVEGKQVNLSGEPRREIVLGNHVWVGHKTTILYNTWIGDGCIVGANSLVKSKIPNNCMIAGTPAKILRKNVAWSQKQLKNGLDDLEEEYRDFTEDN